MCWVLCGSSEWLAPSSMYGLSMRGICACVDACLALFQLLLHSGGAKCSVVEHCTQLVCRSPRERRYIFWGRRGKVSFRVKGGMVKPLVCWVHMRIGLGSFVAWPARGSLLSLPGNPWVVMLAVLIMGGTSRLVLVLVFYAQ